MTVVQTERWPEELIEAVDAARGATPRSEWVREAVEQRLRGEALTDFVELARELGLADEEEE